MCCSLEGREASALAYRRRMSCWRRLTIVSTAVCGTETCGDEYHAGDECVFGGWIYEARIDSVNNSLGISRTSWRTLWMLDFNQLK